MKKRIVSIVLALLTAMSVLSFAASSASAATAPSLSVSNISSGQRITANVSKYYLYFGTYDYNTKKPTWRRYREITSSSFDLVSANLKLSGWIPYGEGKNISTPALSSGTTYCYQIHAGSVNAKGYPIGTNYSGVKNLTYLMVPYLNWTFENNNQLILGAYSQGANDVQFRYRRKNESAYHYVTKTANTNHAVFRHEADTRYEARALYRTSSNGTAYSQWAHVVL